MAQQRLGSRIIAEMFLVVLILAACSVITTDSTCTNIIRMLSNNCGIMKNDGMCCNYKKGPKNPDDDDPNCKNMNCEISGVPEFCPRKCQPSWCWGSICRTEEALRECIKCKCTTRQTCDSTDCGKVDMPCIFPFTYKGKKQHECVFEDGEKDPKNRYGPWCATKLDTTGKMIDGHWGYCKFDCLGVNGTCSTWRHVINKPFRCKEGSGIELFANSLHGDDRTYIIGRSLQQRCERACLSKKEQGCCMIEILSGSQEKCLWHPRSNREEMSWLEAEDLLSQTKPFRKTSTAVLCSPKVTCKNKVDCLGDTAICDNGICVSFYD